MKYPPPVNQDQPVPDEESPASPTGVSQRLLVFLFLLVAVGTSAGLRIQTALGDANFDAHDARPLLRSDPGLLYYITDRIVESGGGIPDNFSADNHIEFPAASNIPEMFSVGQEFVVAWAKLWFDDVPLHIVALWAMSIFASTSLFWIYLLCRELTGKASWAIFATLVALVLLGNYRTIGFLLIREDFSMPWLAMHLYALARAWRLRTNSSIVFAAVAMVLAAATWHAMGFMLTIEAGVILAWHLRSGENPMKVRGAWLFPLVVAIGCVTIPVLRSKGFLFSIPMLIIASLSVSAIVERRELLSPRAVRWTALAAIAVLLPSAGFLSSTLLGTTNDYSHVFELMAAKAKYMGELPGDPRLLSFDVRLLWQGPFDTPTWQYFSGALGIGLLALPIALVAGAWGWFKLKGEGPQNLLYAFIIGGVLAAVLVQRTVVLPTLVAPVILALGLQRIKLVPLRAVIIVGALAWQLQGFSFWLTTYKNPWYLPPERNSEMADVLRWIEANVPPEEPIASDFVTSTAVLAHAGNPILVQPKYETTSTRRRIEQFTDAFSSGSLAEYHQLLKDNDCRYVLTNFHFWRESTYQMGFPPPTPGWMPPADSPFTWFCNPQPRVIRNIPGFELVYRTKNKFAPGYFRVFRRKN
jgi:hypothetical protein